MANKRIFIAVDISDEARPAAAEYVERLRGRFANVRVGWERPEKLHFTLKFLGHVDEAVIPEGQAAVDEALRGHGPFEAELLGTGVFPNARAPRILWLGMGAGRKEMVRLGTAVEAAIEHLGFARDPRPYSPHLTIGRIRQPKDSRDLAGAHIAETFGPIPFLVNQVAIYESTLTRNGSIYTVVSEHAL